MASQLYLYASRTFLFCSLWIGILAYPISAKIHASTTEEAISDMRETALRLIASLDASQKQKLLFDFKDDNRYSFKFTPGDRKGLPMKEISAHQRPLAMALINSPLSHRGQIKASAIMSLEHILLELEQGKGPKRDPELYYLSIFGTPSSSQTWGWRIEGHHLALYYTIVDGKEFVGTPSFFGSNPATVKQGPRTGLRVLAGEEDLARSLMSSLSDAQLKKVVFTNAAPADIFSGEKRKVTALEPVGILASELSNAQKEKLKLLIREYVERLRPELAQETLKRIEKTGWNNIRFGWAGTTKPGEAHYYRVQGPAFLFEYDNIQNNNNHIHAVWRDFENDYGDDLLARHYKKSH